MGAYEWNPTVGTEEHNTSILPDAALRLKIFPNPFSSGTTVSVENKKPSRVKLSVYNSSGLLVKVLQEGVQLTGVSRTLWDGSGDNGRPLPPGIYTVVLNIDGKERQSAKVIKE
jgi:flagellar hook assembly protein FlgD